MHTDLLDENLELEEADVFGSPAAKAAEDAMQGRDQPCEQSDGEESDEDEFDGNMDGLHSGSAKSTTLNVVLESPGVSRREDHDELSTSGLHGRGARPTPGHRGMAHSLAVHSTLNNVKMGSSVPINIPFMAARPRPAEPQQAAMPATFVPPHQLSQRDDYTLAMMGESPSNAMKRDRLRVRNAILKSTGFLEQTPGLPTLSEVKPGSAFKGLGPGGLKQALQLAGSPAL